MTSIFPFMIEHNGPGSYRKALEHIRKTFAFQDPAEMALRSGAVYDRTRSVITLSSLGQSLEVSFPAGEAVFSGGRNFPLWQWELVALSYLSRADGAPLSGNLITFRELEGGGLFFPAFYKNTTRRLAEVADTKDLQQLKAACEKLDGCLTARGDLGASFSLFPCFPVVVIIWQGDEEMATSASILFDETANRYLPTEDIAAAGNMIVGFLCSLCL